MLNDFAKKTIIQYNQCNKNKLITSAHYADGAKMWNIIISADTTISRMKH